MGWVYTSSQLWDFSTLSIFSNLQVWLVEPQPIDKPKPVWDIHGDPVSISKGLQRCKGFITQVHWWRMGPPHTSGCLMLPAPGCSWRAGQAKGQLFILFNKMNLWSVGGSDQNLEIIWIWTLCSSMFRGFPRSYHETLPCNIPSEDYYDIYTGRETEITEFESLLICSQAFLMSGNNLHFQIHNPLNFL